MKKIIASLLFLCFACASAPKSKVIVNGLNDSKKYHSSVGKIFIQTKDGSELVGTAFAIDEENLITAGHVCQGFIQMASLGMTDGGIYMERVNSKGEEVRTNGFEIVRFDVFMFDLCQLKKTGHELDPLKIIENYNNVKYLDDICIYGSIDANIPIPNCGVVIKSDSIRQSRIFEKRLVISAAISPGNSGGPVLNRNGEVIGVISSKLNNYDHYGTCITANELKVFLTLPKEFFNR